MVINTLYMVVLLYDDDDDSDDDDSDNNNSDDYLIIGPRFETTTPIARASYQRHLLSDEGCADMTDRMQVKLGKVTTDRITSHPALC
jgi:hypothetical protein